MFGCPQGQLDQNNDDVAYTAMQTRISLRTKACLNRDCTPTDEFLVAALAENESISPMEVQTAINQNRQTPPPAIIDGYLGGLMDTATGLLYMGNGQYYDPSTGRFLNRNANPNGTNPYVPWGGEPSAAFMAPLALLSLFYSRRKVKGRKEKILLTLLILVLAIGVTGLTLSACGPAPSPAPGGGPTTPPTGGGTPQPGTTPGNTPTPGGTPTPQPTPCQTPTPGSFVNDYYDRQAAVDFVTDSRNYKDKSVFAKDYPTDPNNDCTNFVSYALQAGGLQTTSEWYPSLTDGAWPTTIKLFNFLKNHGFHESVAFTNTWDISDPSGNKSLMLRNNSEDTRKKQQVSELWSDYLSLIKNARPGDLVFYEDKSWQNLGWSHVGIITGDWQAPTHHSFTSILPFDQNEPQIVDHDGPTSELPRSIGDTNGQRITSVIVLYGP
jgi:hypothetical protein